MGKSTNKKVKVEDIISMRVVNPYSAGIDIGDREIVVAVYEGVKDEPRVRTFGTMTCDLHAISAFLKRCEVDTVAMESTGVYWKPLFAQLSKDGFEVLLANARHVKNVTGRKDDENDAMWIQKLHSVGFLKSSYLPDSLQEQLRTLVRHRRTYVQDSSSFTNRIQKSLELMNIKLHTVIADIMGKTGRAIVEAIIAGERNAANFLPLVDKKIKTDLTTIEKSLQGNWSDEHLFTLEQNYEMHNIFWTKIAACDREIAKKLQEMEAMNNDGEVVTAPIEAPEATMAKPETSPAISGKEVSAAHPEAKEEKKEDGLIRKRLDKNSPRIDVQGHLKAILGVDVMAIYGISATGALEIFAETGTDMTKWKDEKHFVAWLNLCPNNKISGGKLISSKLAHKAPNLASLAFRAAANGLQRSDNWLGDYFRRMKTRGGNKYAIIAVANKIAKIYYKMVRNKEDFRPVELAAYQQKYNDDKIAKAEKYLNKLKEKKANLAA